VGIGKNFEAFYIILIISVDFRGKLNLKIVFVFSLGHIPSSGIVLTRSAFAVIVTSVLEAKTDQVDNLALPLVMYMLLLPFPRTFC
jgi:hypothetical protein